MAIPLDELKRQREQIQKHLDWLDAQIAEQDGSMASRAKAAETKAEAPTRSPGQPLEKVGPDASSEAPSKADTEAEAATKTPEGARERARHAADQAQVAPVADFEMPDPEAPQFKAKTAEEARRAKIGCFAVFILATALFLFLLFVLPYWL